MILSSALKLIDPEKDTTSQGGQEKEVQTEIHVGVRTEISSQMMK
jgi:hypothetical protein